jgi:hypothetical protein
MRWLYVDPSRIPQIQNILTQNIYSLYFSTLVSHSAKVPSFRRFVPLGRWYCSISQG